MDNTKNGQHFPQHFLQPEMRRKNLTHNATQPELWQPAALVKK
jgi:hypothetical protein